MLTTLEPSSGPAVPPGHTYGPPFYLPGIEVASDQRQTDIDTSSAGFQQMSEGQGSMLTNGSQSLWVDQGRIVPTFLFHAGYLKLRGFTQDYSGALNALAKFDVYVLQGGVCRLTWQAPAGYKNPVTGATVRKAITEVVAGRGTPVLSTPDQSGVYVTYQVNLDSPSGYWTLDDGSWVSLSSLF